MSAAQRPARSDRRRMMITPEGIALPVMLASRGTRFGALLIDLGAMFAAFVAVMLVLGLTAGSVAGQLDKLQGSARSSIELDRKSVV